MEGGAAAHQGAFYGELHYRLESLPLIDVLVFIF